MEPIHEEPCEDSQCLSMRDFNIPFQSSINTSNCLPKRSQNHRRFHSVVVGGALELKKIKKEQEVIA